MRLLLLPLLCLTLFSVSACETINETMDTMVADFEKAFKGGPSAKGEGQITDIALQGECPQIRIVDELSMISEFTDLTNPRPTNLISHAEIGNVRSACEFEEDTVIVDLKVDFKSTLGDKARQRSGDKPFLSYPFFVAVLSPSNRVMAKEVFASSFEYNEEENEKIVTEGLRQVIPLDSRFPNANRHAVYIGFQLDETQLAYNRKMIELGNFTKELKDTSVQTFSPERQKEEQPRTDNKLETKKILNSGGSPWSRAPAAERTSVEDSLVTKTNGAGEASDAPLSVKSQ